jgi:hypothetical protein
METHILSESKKVFDPLATNCAFCKTGTHSKSKQDNYLAPVYRTQNRTNLVVYRNVKFNEIKIGIPRCKSCKSAHSVVKTASHLSVFIGVILFFVITMSLSMMFDAGIFGMIISMAVAFGLIYLMVTGIEKAILSYYNVITEKEGALKEPLVREFLRNGWSIDRPKA